MSERDYDAVFEKIDECCGIIEQLNTFMSSIKQTIRFDMKIKTMNEENFSGLCEEIGEIRDRLLSVVKRG